MFVRSSARSVLPCKPRERTTQSKAWPRRMWCGSMAAESKLSATPRTIRPVRSSAAGSHHGKRDRMRSVPSSNKNLKRILIVRLSSMGDVIQTLPAAALLRNTFPHATLGWLIEERWAELLCTLSTPRSGPRSSQRPLVDVVHTVNLKRWRRSLFSTQTWERIAAGLSDLRGMQYQTAIDLQGAVRSGVLARWSGAPAILGSTHPRESLASVCYTSKIVTEKQHVVEQYCEVAQALAGSSLSIPGAILPCDPLAEDQVQKRLAEQGIVDFVILSPGAGWGAKQWPTE